MPCYEGVKHPRNVCLTPKKSLKFFAQSKAPHYSKRRPTNSDDHNPNEKAVVSVAVSPLLGQHKASSLRKNVWE